MAYTIPQKAIELCKEMQDKLVLRLGSVNGTTAVAVSAVQFDTDGLPFVLVGPGTTTTKSACIKIVMQNWPLAKDVLGNVANIYAPLTVQLATEAPAAGSGAGVYLDLPSLLPILGELVMKGSRVEWYQSANGVAPTVAALIAGNLKASFQPDIYNILTSQQ